MTGRERVKAAIAFKPVDRAPLQYLATSIGFYEHGEKLNDLYATLPGDFGPFVRSPIPVLPPEDFDADGRYHTFTRDEWGTVWERRIYGLWGMPSEYPLAGANAQATAAYRFPERATHSGEDIARERIEVTKLQQLYYTMHGGGSLMERLRGLLPEEELLMGIAADEPHINALADRIVEYHAPDISHAIEVGTDCLSFGDDYGTERGLLMNPAMWRRFFKPRLRHLFEPAVRAGLDIHFHSCGVITPIIPDLREVGVTSIWPQLPAYDMEELAALCRAEHLAVAIHTDRANIMTNGTPAQVRELAKREFDTFRMMEGGSWFYVEVDNGFPFANIEALVETIAQWR